MRLLPLLAVCLVFVSGCKAIDAMDNTTDMKHDLADMKHTTGGMATTTNDLDSNMKNLHGDAAISVGLALIVAPENTKEYAPPSKNLVTGAKLIAENMDSKQLIEYLFGALKELRETKPKASEFNTELLGNYRPSYVLQFNTEQQVRVITLQAIAGQIPQAMLEKMIDEQINRGGNRIQTMYTVLMLRAMYIDSIKLQQDAFNTEDAPWSALGEMQTAADLTANLDYVASLPYADKIGFVATPTCFLAVVNPPVLHRVPGAGMLVPEQTFPKLPDDASDEDKAAQEAAKKAYQDQLDAQAAKDAAQSEYQSKCVNPVGGKKDPGCYPTLGDAPSFNVQLDPRMAKHWWKKLAQNITGYLNQFRDGEQPREVGEMIRLRDEANANK